MEKKSFVLASLIYYLGSSKKHLAAAHRKDYRKTFNELSMNQVGS